MGAEWQGCLVQCERCVFSPKVCATAIPRELIDGGNAAFAGAAEQPTKVLCQTEPAFLMHLGKVWANSESKPTSGPMMNVALQYGCGLKLYLNGTLVNCFQRLAKDPNPQKTDTAFFVKVTMV